MRYLRAFRTSRSFKILLIFFSVIGIVYQLLFSPWGNRLLSPLLEKALTGALSTPVSVQEFSLTHNRFDLLIQDHIGNTISTQGGFSLLTLRLYAHYRIEFFNNGGLNTLHIPLKTEGLLNGGIAVFDIRGSAHMLEGDALYRLQLHRFKLASLHAELNRIGYETLLHRFEYPSSTDTRVWGTIDLRGFDRRRVEGFIHLVSKTGRFEPTEILPDEDNEPFSLRSLLADRYGRVQAFDTHVTLKASLQHAGILEQFMGVHMAGPAAVDAVLEGNQKQLQLRATTTLADSDTALSLLITDLEPERIELEMMHADIPHLFDLFALPSPLTGRADAKGLFTAQHGELHLSLSDAKTLPDVLKKDYNITQPPIRFDAKLAAEITEEGVRYQGAFVSDLQRIELNNSVPHDQMLRELLKTIR
ncbi:MAG: hypothetical protein JXK04_02840 [Campylobacterales bacterium]|nr:hypothetical protein [Campylobacterales bacterium]